MDLQREELDVLQADLDDESPQVLAAFIERALAEGALDAHLTPILMKKGRPAVRLEVLARPDDRERFLRLILTETATLGVKVRRVERYALPRRFDTVEIDGHKVRIKVALLEGKAVRGVPEFEDCRRVALATGQPVRSVVEQAKTRWTGAPADS
jgi:uncharacterized protein (DUF111 family)